LGNDLFSVTTPTVGVWQHWALVRSGTIVSWYVNGVLDSTTTNSVNLADSTAAFNVGYADTWAVYGNFGISNLRIVKGTAVYTTNFTPSTTPLTAITNTVLLAFQSNRIVDNSSGALPLVTHAGSPTIQATSPFEPTAAWTPLVNGGSMYFNGTTDYLAIPSSTSMSFGTSNFTIECWAYLSAGASTGVLFSTSVALSDWKANGAGAFFFGFGSSSIATGTASQSDFPAYSITPTLNSWHHFALVRNGNLVSIYCDGVSISSQTYTGTMGLSNTSAGISKMDSFSSGRGYVTGSMSNVRVVKGTAVYATTFTPPTAPLTAIANTSLLLSGTNLGVIDAAGKNDLITIGSASTSTAQKKFGSKSLAFNGSTDYLTLLPGQQQLTFGASDFTVEAWVYPTKQSGVQTVYSGQSDGTTASGSAICCYIAATAATCDLYIGSAGYSATSPNPPANQWSHVAYVRHGTTWSTYLNGTQVGSVVIPASAVNGGATTYPPAVGSTTGGNLMQGYIDDLRITKGVARYTTGFTVPTSAYGDSTVADPYFNQVSLLLHADGTSYTAPVYNNTTILDSSVNAFAVTATGTPTQGTFSPFGNNGWGAVFNGTTDYVTVPNSSLIGTGPFTLEMWINPQASGGTIMGSSWWSIGSNGGFSLDISAAGIISLPVYTGKWNGGNATVFTSPVAVANYAWSHIAIVRNVANLVTFYINGVAATSATYANSLSMQETSHGNAAYGTRFAVGQLVDGVLHGYSSLTISNARLVTGTALYTSTFTPPTTQLTAVAGTTLLTFQNNNFIDNSANAYTLTTAGTPHIQAGSPASSGVTYSTGANGGSLVFNGSTDYLSITSAAALTLGASNFTMETWIYPTATGGQILAKYGASGAGAFVFQLNTSNVPILYSCANGGGSGWNVTALGATAVTLNVWSHVAVTRFGNTFTVWVNGVSSATTTASFTLYDDPTIPVMVGNSSAGGTKFTGYMSNVRIVKGTAVYTAAFTPSSAPLTAVPGTALLLSGVGSGVIDGTGKNDVTTVGTAKTQSAIVKYGTGALQFNGTTDYLTVPSNAAFAFGTGDFTVEAWVNMQAAKAGCVLMDLRPVGTQGAYPLVYFDVSGSTNTLNWYANSTPILTSTLPALTNWVHIAVVRKSGVITQYINGTTSASTTDSTNYLSSTAMYIGAGQITPGLSSSCFSGYIDDLRITKGIARYTANFTAPTAALPNSSIGDANFNQVSLLLQGDIQTASRRTAKNNTNLDSSVNQLPVNSSVAQPWQGSFTPFNANWSAAFNGTSDSAYTTNSIAGVPLTFEAWIKYDNNAGQYNGSLLMSQHTGGNGGEQYFGIDKDAYTLSFSVNSALGTYGVNSGTNTITPNVWTHVALTLSATGSRIFINGNLVGYNATVKYWQATSRNVNIGYGEYGPSYFKGSMSNLRITTGTALYTSNFTPSTTPLNAVIGTQLLTFQDSSFIDRSSNNYVGISGAPAIQPSSPFAVPAYSVAANGGSMFFDGTNDFLRVPSSAAINLSTGDFTLETWMYMTANAHTTARILDKDGTFTVYPSYALSANSGVVSFLIGSGGATTAQQVVTSSVTVPVNTWAHVAAVKYGTTLTLYINGVSTGSATQTVTITDGGANLYVGAANAGIQSVFNGYLSNVRITKSAVYTGNFTPATTPIAAIANTQLLLSGTNCATPDTSGNNDFIAYGGAQVGSNSMFGTGALVLNGSTDYLATATTGGGDFGTGDFTVEFWMNAVAAGTTPVAVVGTQAISGNATAGMWRVVNRYNGTNGLYLCYTTGGAWSDNQLSAVNYNDGAWHHVAVTRRGTIVRGFVDGVLVGTLASVSQNLTSGQKLLVGYQAQDGAYFTGSIDDLRITKGVARYTAGFTPPTAALPTH